MTFMNEYPHLCNQGKGNRKQGESIPGNCELTNADKANSKLRNSKDPARKLTDCNDAFDHDRHSFERYLNEIWTRSKLKMFFCVLYSNPLPSHLSWAGYGAPQRGQVKACSEMSLLRSLHGYTVAPFNPRAAMHFSPFPRRSTV